MTSLRRPAGQILWATLVAAGCHSPSPPPPTSERVELTTPAAFAEAGRARAKDQGKVQDNWLATFAEPALDALVAEAQAHNPDLAAAVASRDRALAQAGVADSALAPKVDAVGGASRSDTGNGAGNRYDLGLSVSWEVDVWGRLADQSAAAQADVMAATADLELTRLENDLLQQRLRVQRITRARLDVGEARPMDLDLADGQVAVSRQTATESGGALDSALRSLEVLVGRYPSREIEVAEDLPALPGPVPVGLPSDLLERRPDLIAADRRVAAAFQRVGAAKAAKLPSLSLTASGGQASDGLSSLMDPGQVVWNLGANLLGPLFDGGELAARERIAQADEQAALANYVRAAQQAFLEVETALGNERILRQRETELTEAEARLRAARDAGEIRYEEGEMSIVDLDQLHTNHAQAARALLQVRQELLQQRINLHLALGGSFSATPTDQS
jgi:multidrug efflux system outer membrane protein